MRPIARRDRSHNSLAARLWARRRRGGFTLVEMMVSVTLVVLMMLMFAEIYGLAQETISKQKGIATNDQKARIMAEVLRTDLETRTFRSVYPFKMEMAFNTSTNQVEPTIPSGATSAEQTALLGKRQGYLEYSENDPADDTDDTLQFTVNLARGDGTGHSIFGKATAGGGVNSQDWPEYDDGREGDNSGSSTMAEVSYYLRYGNLYRSVLLIRKPYQPQPHSAHPAWGATTPDSFPANYTVGSGSFWRDFDYSAFREPDDDPNTAGNQPAMKFHGSENLSNNPNTAIADPPPNQAELYQPPGVAEFLFLPRSLGAPQLRFGHSLTIHGQPFEFASTYDSSMAAVDAAGDGDGAVTAADWATFKGDRLISRFNAQERSVVAATFAYPGQGFAPFAPDPAVIDPDGNGNADDNNDGIVDIYSAGTRRGVDIMMPNVHSFDVQVWDDVVGRFVDLGHTEEGINPYDPLDSNGDGVPEAEPGFYHISRLRSKYNGPAAPPLALTSDHGSVPQDFGNRYDTWSPNMYVQDSVTTPTQYWRNGRAPYRPLQSNPPPNDANFNTPTTTGADPIPKSYEQRVAFGDMTLNDDGDNKPAEFNAQGQPAPNTTPPVDPPNTTGDSDAEAPLRAIRIVVRYIDPHSGQTRQATIEQSLID